MVLIDVSAEECRKGALTDEHREAAVRAIEEEGFVVLGGVVDTAHLDTLHERIVADIPLLLQRDDAPFNWNVGNIQQNPPPFAPYLFADVLLNELVLDVTCAVLGNGVKNAMYGGNTAMPSTERQPVHADTGHLWPRLEVAHPPVHLVINIPTVDVSPDNGSTELWPGTHKDVTITAGVDIKIPHDVLEKRRAEVPPIQPTFKRGGVLIRDMRLWHAGMPNRTQNPRPMLAMIHAPHWLDTGLPLTFPASTQEFFKNPRLNTCAQFVEEEIDHIHATHGYEYEKS